MGGVPVPRHCAGRAMQRAGTKSRNQRYEPWRMPYAHSSLVIHRVRMPYGIPRVACCASLNLWTETHGVCGLPLSTYLTSELFRTYAVLKIIEGFES